MGTLAIIVLLMVLVMGGLFVYKRFYAKPNVNIGMHFENPRSAASMEAARVKMCKLNEIMITRNINNNNNNIYNNSQNSVPPSMSTMLEEDEFNEPTTHDDTQKLLF